MKRIDITYKDIDKLKDYEKNPRLNDEAVPLVAKSISEFGMKVPIVIDENDVIVCGHTRVKALKELGETEVPCIVADDLTPEQIKAFRLADNKVAEAAGWDFELLDAELDGLADDFDMEDFGFILEDFSSDEVYEEDDLEEDEVEVRDKKEPAEIPDEEPVPDVMTTIRRDDMIKLGRHTLFCTSAFEIDYKRALKEDIDLSIVTPSWTEDPSDDVEEFVSSCDSRSRYTVCCAPWGAAPGRFFEITKNMWPDDLIYWMTDDPMPETDCKITPTIHPIPVYSNKGEKDTNDIEPWTGVIKGILPKTMSSVPLYLPTEIIEHMTPEGGTVLAPYGGGGTVLIACEDTGRTCAMFEPDPIRCELICQRYVERVGSFDGIKIVRDNTVIDWN